MEGYLLPILLLLASTAVYASNSSKKINYRNHLIIDVHVIGLQGERDDAVDRFIRSLEVFGYEYTMVDLSKHGRVTSDVSFEKKLSQIQQSVESVSEEYTLILDSHSSFVLDTPESVLKAAKDLEDGFVFVDIDKNVTNTAPSAESIFEGMLTKTFNLKALLKTIEGDSSSDMAGKLLGALADVTDHSNITIDEKSQLFQFIESDSDEYLEIRFDGDRGYVQNARKQTIPPILVGSAGGKQKLNSMSNYLVRAWSPETGCQMCDEERIDLSQFEIAEYPVIQVTVLVSEPMPFLGVFFERLANLTYPKQRISLVTYCQIEKQQHIIDSFIANYSDVYRSVQQINVPASESDVPVFRKALSICRENEDCSYLFYLDATAQLKKADTLEHLVAAKMNAIAPLMTRFNAFWSTFWGAMTEEGFYSRSDDYFNIVERRQTGLWNVPLVGSSILFSRWAVTQIQAVIDKDGYLPNEIAIAALERNVFLFVDNREEFGHLVNPENYTFEHLHNDLWQIFDNPKDWEERYMHQDYFKFADNKTTKEDFEEPCPDVFWMPLMSQTFCQELIEEVEQFGQWSSGNHSDPRLEGGYENVPTVDIHMRQMGWEKHWMGVLQKYVYPIQLKLWEGYTDTPTARMNFVVRYRQEEQPSLRLHHDASTYTLDMALNRAHIDYTGGGVSFPRYNCTLLDTRVGWPLIFPGRLTHLHEGLETMTGTRYIFVTFVNP